MESKVERYVENYVVNKNTMALLPVILSEKKIVTRVVEVQDSFFVFQNLQILQKEVVASMVLVSQAEKKERKS